MKMEKHRWWPVPLFIMDNKTVDKFRLVEFIIGLTFLTGGNFIVPVIIVIFDFLFVPIKDELI